MIVNCKGAPALPRPPGAPMRPACAPGEPSEGVEGRGDLELAHQRIRSLLYDPSLRFTDLLDLYGELLDRLERYGF